jgi:hypothetical protein
MIDKASDHRPQTVTVAVEEMEWNRSEKERREKLVFDNKNK